MIDGITPLHLIIVLVIAVLILGPGKLPSVGKSLGESIREFRRSMSDVKDAVSLEPAAVAAVAPVAPPPASLVAPMAAASATVLQPVPFGADARPVAPVSQGPKAAPKVEPLA